MSSVSAEDIKSELDTFNIAFTNETVDKSKAVLLSFLFISAFLHIFSTFIVIFYI